MSTDLVYRLQDAIRTVRDVPGRTYREAAQLLNLASWDLVEDRWGDFRVPKLIKMAFCSVADVRDLARRLLAKRGYSEDAIREAHQRRAGELVTYEELKAARKYLAQAALHDPSGRTTAGAPALYTHIALQLEVCDYSTYSVFAVLESPKPELADLRNALLRDLICAFIDAAYFKEYAKALRRRERDPEARIPVHRFGKFALNPDIYPEKSNAQDEEMRKLGAAPLQWHAQWMFMGRGVRDIFDCQGNDDRLSALVAEAKQAERENRLYLFLFELTQFDEQDLVVPEPDVVAAAAAVASFRLTMAIIGAANAAISFAADDPGLAAEVLPIIQQICRLTHFTYLDAAERIGHSLHKLPRETKQFRTDRETIGYGYHTTELAFIEPEGAWFRLDRGEKMEVCFLGAHGSAIWDCDEGKLIFRFVTGDEACVPSKWERSRDLHYLYC